MKKLMIVLLLLSIFAIANAEDWSVSLGYNINKGYSLGCARKLIDGFWIGVQYNGNSQTDKFGEVKLSHTTYKWNRTITSGVEIFADIYITKTIYIIVSGGMYSQKDYDGNILQIYESHNVMSIGVGIDITNWISVATIYNTITNVQFQIAVKF